MTKFSRWSWAEVFFGDEDLLRWNDTACFTRYRRLSIDSSQRPLSFLESVEESIARALKINSRMVLSRSFGLCTRMTHRIFNRTFCVKPHSKGAPATTRADSVDKEAQRLSDQAKMSQNLWDFMVPERNMGVTHPFFLVLLVLTVSLHMYNNHRDREEDERLRQKRINRKPVGE